MRRQIANAATAAFFLLLAALFAWSSYNGLFSMRACGGPGQRACGFADTYYPSIERPLTALLAVFCLALGLRVIWNMRGGDRS